MTSRDQNPYESPAGEGSPPPPIVRLIAAVPLVVVAAGVAFCCTCLPIGFVGFIIGHKGEAKPFAPEGEVAMGAAWIVGTLVGFTAGAAVWIAARRPARDEPQKS